MVHVKVMQSEDQRRAHASRFNRSIRRAGPRRRPSTGSVASSQSSILLEQMCATLVASTVLGKEEAAANGGGLKRGKHSKSFDELSLGEAASRLRYDDEEAALALSLADLLPRASRDISTDPRGDILAEGGQQRPPTSDEGDTPVTLRSILRSPSAEHLPNHTGTSPGQRVRISPAVQRSVYCPHASPSPKPSHLGDHVVCLVSTKDYDGERQKRQVQVARHSPTDTPGTQASSRSSQLRACIDQILLRELQGDAHAEVTDMMWTESVAPFREGVYSGCVDKEMRPHGRGAWEATGGKGEEEKDGKERLCGWFYRGSFIPYDYIDRKYSFPATEESQRKQTVDNNDVFSQLPPLPFPGKASGQAVDYQPASRRSKQKQPKPELKHRQREPERPYELGDQLRSPSDVFGEAALIGNTLVHMISDLKEGDGAFVKRSEGGYTYATVSKRWDDPKYGEETLVFIVNAKGCTKSVPKRWWRTCLRLLRPSTASPRSVKRTVGRQVRSNEASQAKQPRDAKSPKLDKRQGQPVPMRRHPPESASSQSTSLKLPEQSRRKSDGDGGVSSVESESSDDSSTEYWT